VYGYSEQVQVITGDLIDAVARDQRIGTILRAAPETAAAESRVGLKAVAAPQFRSAADQSAAVEPEQTAPAAWEEDSGQAMEAARAMTADKINEEIKQILARKATSEAQAGQPAGDRKTAQTDDADDAALTADRNDPETVIGPDGNSSAPGPRATRDAGPATAAIDSVIVRSVARFKEGTHSGPVAPADGPNNEDSGAEQLRDLVVNAGRRRRMSAGRGVVWLVVGVALLVGGAAWHSRDAWNLASLQALTGGAETAGFSAAPTIPVRTNARAADGEAGDHGLAARQSPARRAPISNMPTGVEVTQADAKQTETRKTQTAEAGVKLVEVSPPEANQAEAKQAEAKQAEAKQAEAKQAEAKQAEAKQAEAKQAEVDTAAGDATGQAALVTSGHAGKQAAVAPVTAESTDSETAAEATARQALALQREAQHIARLQAESRRLEEERRAAERQLAAQREARLALERKARLERERIRDAKKVVEKVAEERAGVTARLDATLDTLAPGAPAEPVHAAPVTSSPPPQEAAVAEAKNSAAPAGQSRDDGPVAESASFLANPCNGPTARFMSTCF
jgi:hypothetical protein